MWLWCTVRWEWWWPRCIGPVLIWTIIRERGIGLVFIQKEEFWSQILTATRQGGKGRTGTMICVWLIESGVFSSAALRCLRYDQVKVGLIMRATVRRWIFLDFPTPGPKSTLDICSLDYFGNRRTDTNVSSKFQGVETPSQSRLSQNVRRWQFMAGHWESCSGTCLFSSTFSIRYVAYYEKMKNNGRVLPEAVPLMLTQIQITGGCSIAMQDIPKTQNNFRPHVLWSRGRLWLLCGGWSGDHEFANVETKLWFLLLFLPCHWIVVV